MTNHDGKLSSFSKRSIPVAEIIKKQRLDMVSVYLLLKFLKDRNAVEGASVQEQPRMVLKYTILRGGPIAKPQTLERYLNVLLTLDVIVISEKYADYRLTKRGLDWLNRLKEPCESILRLF